MNKKLFSLFSIISLFTGFAFLIKDKGETRRTWNSLTVRLVLAALLIGFLVYGIVSGQLGSKAPWDAYKAPQAQQQTTAD